MSSSLEKKMKFLTIYVIILSLLCVCLAYIAFRKAGRRAFDELTVKRINVVDESGRQLRLVISNEKRQHPGRPDGKDLAARSRPAGILFFNNEGDEAGGLTYYAEKDGKQLSSGASLTMDQYHNDQVVQLTNNEYYDGSGAQIGRRGLAVNEIPLGLDLYRTMEKYDSLKKITDPLLRKRGIDALRRTEGITNRLFVGRNEQGEYGLFVFDTLGRYRFKIFVDSVGNPKIETLDNSGHTKNFIIQ